jgi:tyrosine-protein kinase Etk/Wzc
MQPSWQQFTQEPEKGVDWRRYVAAALRYKWLVIVCTVLGTGGSVAATRLISPEYRAQATVWIETANNQGGPLQQSQLLESTSWIELLKTFVVLDYSVQALKLYLRYGSPADSAVFSNFELTDRFRPGNYVLAVGESGGHLELRTSEGNRVETASPGDSLGSSLGFGWVPPPTALRAGQEVPFSVERPRDAARGLGDRLNTRLDRNGNILRVELYGPNPVRTAVAVNTVIERFVDVAADLKREKLTETASTIRERLQQAENALEAAENALESFRIRTITLPRDQAGGPVAAGLESTRDPVFDRFFDMTVQLDQLDRDRSAIIRATQYVADSGLSVDALENIETIQQSTLVMQALQELGEMRAELRALQRTYTEEHPVVVRLAGDVQELERTTVPSLLAVLVNQLDSRRLVLNTRVQEASGDLQQIPRRMIEEARLRRDVDVAENLYTTLQQAYEEARLAEESSMPDVRVLDNAVIPTRPLADQAPRMLLMGIVAGLGMGLVGAILLDRIDRRVRYPEQVTSDLGLQLLGVVPHLRGVGNGTGAAEAAPIVEALRGVKLNLVHACGSASPLVVTVSSPGAGDGKSFVVSNLALAFADAGHRTLLIDADTRRGALHRVLNAARKPGLTDFLSGTVGRAEIVQETPYPALSFIGCGTRTPSAPELIGSTAMTQLMTGLRSTYSVIVIDSPPLGAGVDAFALGTLTGNLMVVLRLGQTDRELAEAKLDVLDRLPVRILGAVLNDVRDGGAAKYFKYYSYYMPGYEAEDEEGGEAAKALIGGDKG